MKVKPIHCQETGLSEEKPPVPLQATSVLYVEGAPVDGGLFGTKHSDKEPAKIRDTNGYKAYLHT